MPVKHRQPTRQQKSTANSFASNSHSSSKSKAVGQQQSTDTSAPQYPDPNAYLPPTLASLRRDWRWAAVSQFLYTFQGPLRIDPYIEVELENDLAYGTDVTLSRIVHRLLFTLAQDRKISPTNWMGYLQGQYARRYSARPNPFYQDMIPPAPPNEDKKPTKLEEEDNTQEHPKQEAPEASSSDPDTETKPNETSVDPSPHTDSNMDIQPIPEISAGLEGEPPTKLTVPATPEPTIKLTPMRQWSDLSQSEQLDVLWTLCEWQFQGAMRLRSLLGEEDSGVGWRMEPVGWDSKKNIYWLVGETRLWVQHHVALPKLPPKKKSRITRPIVLPLEAAISSRAPPSFGSDDETKATPEVDQPAAKHDSDSELSEVEDPTPRPKKSNGASKPTKQIGSTKKRSAEESRTQSSNSRKRVRMAGTRVSSRLKGTDEKNGKDEWQAVPDEWQEQGRVESVVKDDPFGSDSDLTEVDELERELEEDRIRRKKLEDTRQRRQSGRKKGSGGEKKGRGGLEASESAEVEEIEEQNDGGASSADGGKRAQLPVRLHMAPLVDPMLPPSLPPGFIEWETVCATLQDWEAFPARFEKATHPNEKSFRSFLNNVLVPTVATSLRSQLKVKKLETAVQNRKRSSRIAIKESIVEAQRQEEGRRAEELELHARSRRIEERERRAQEDMLRRERDRGDKVRLRETRAGRRTIWDGETTESGSASPVPDPMPTESVKIRLRPGRGAGGSTSASPVPSPAEPSSASGTSSRTDESWELLCEGCGKQGWNIDDGSQLVKCESCGRWSHTTCHDRADELAGKPKRDWSSVDFTCRACSNTIRKPFTNGAPKTNGNTVMKPNGLVAPAFMYTSFQAIPNGQTPTQLPAYPNNMLQPVYSTQNQPRIAEPVAFAPFIQHQSTLMPTPTPIPMPRYQTPVPPYSQPPAAYSSPYPNGHPGL